jgi:hypothetical protein
MKANKRVRDLRRRSKTGLRRWCERGNQFVTASIWTRDKHGNRIENVNVRIL